MLPDWRPQIRKISSSGGRPPIWPIIESERDVDLNIHVRETWIPRRTMTRWQQRHDVRTLLRIRTWLFEEGPNFSVHIIRGKSDCASVVLLDLRQVDYAAFSKACSSFAGRRAAEASLASHGPKTPEICMNRRTNQQHLPKFC
jgi:hypothetical protein